MIEVIDISSKLKLMAIRMVDIEYKDDKYVVYLIERTKGEVNIFVSKLVISSEGYTFNNKFDNGEREVIDGVIKKIINKENVLDDGFKIGNLFSLSDTNYFDIDVCYVATINKNIIDDVMRYYNLKTREYFDRPVVEMVEDKKVFNEGFVGNLFLIVFGGSVIIFCIISILRVLL